MRKIQTSFFFLSMLLLIMGCGPRQETPQKEDSQSVSVDYNPAYWLEGVIDSKKQGGYSDADISLAMDSTASKGWQGIMVWGADRNGDQMNYYFNSPFLEKQSWAVAEKNNLDAIVAAAHKDKLKVMVNIEGVNPYHWTQNHWTPDNISSVATDLASNKIDAVFEECFEVRPDIFSSLARSLKTEGVTYVSGTDPMIFREPSFTALWPETGMINVYNYYLKRDKIFNIATLAQNGSMGYGWAKYWKKPTSLISPLNRNWGIATDYSPAVVSYICMIRALQFRLDNFIIFGGKDQFDPIANRKWIKDYVGMQEEKRPLMNIVVLLKNQKESSGSELGNAGWNRLFNSGDAITSGAFNAGYNIIVSDKVVPADAYWIYAPGGEDSTLPDEVVNLFQTEKPVFLQCASGIPGGQDISAAWKSVLNQCGVNGTKTFLYGGGAKGNTSVSLPPSQEQEIPYTGYYKDTYLRFTGADMQRGKDLRAGTILPDEAIDGTIYCRPNDTYGKGPYIIGKNKKYLVTATALNWEVAYPISDLLSGSGVAPTSHVWGIAGKGVPAMLAVDPTELQITIPGLKEGAKIHVVVWDNKKNKKFDEEVSYHAPFRHWMNEYDFVLINAVK